MKTSPSLKERYQLIQFRQNSRHAYSGGGTGTDRERLVQFEDHEPRGPRTEHELNLGTRNLA